MRHDEILGLLPHLNYTLDDRPDLRLLLLELVSWAVVIVVTLALVRFRPVVLERAESRIHAISQHTRFWLAAFPLLVIVVRLALLPWVPTACSRGARRVQLPPGRGHCCARARDLRQSPAGGFRVVSYQRAAHLPVHVSTRARTRARAGTKVDRSSLVGVLLSVALMCAAIYWMPPGWLPAPWGWLGGAFGCARVRNLLLLGEFLLRRGDRGSRWIARSRSLATPAPRTEGAGRANPRRGAADSRKQPPAGRISLQLALAYSPWPSLLVKNGRVNWSAAAKAVLPAIALLALGAGWMLYYNWRGTGHALVMPYQVNLQTYHITKPFFFQKPNPIPYYRHPEMRAVYVHTSPAHCSGRTRPILRASQGQHSRRNFLWPFCS